MFFWNLVILVLLNNGNWFNPRFNPAAILIQNVPLALKRPSGDSVRMALKRPAFQCKALKRPSLKMEDYSLPFGQIVL
jgi:hypothetical protein